MRKSAVPQVRPGRRATRRGPRRLRHQTGGHVAVLRADAGPRQVERRHAGRGVHPDTARGAPGPGDRSEGAVHQGRGGQPHRLVQGAGPVGGGLEGQGAWPDRADHAIGGQRRRGHVRVRGKGGHGRVRIHAERRPRGQRQGGRDHGRRPDPDRRPDQRRRTSLASTGRGARAVRRFDPPGALPRRGEEDDGLRDRGADVVDAARRHRIPDRRRDRHRGHVEGVRGDGGARLDRIRSGRRCSACSRTAAPPS